MTTQTQEPELSENISEKRKRGRPKSALLAGIKGIFFEGGRRSTDNKRSMTHALGILKAAGEVESYFHAEGKTLMTVLSALGRFSDQDIPVLAQHIAEKKMRTLEALSYLRMMRGKPIGVDTLTTAIISAIVERGHEFTLDDAEEALCDALERIRCSRKRQRDLDAA